MQLIDIKKVNIGILTFHNVHNYGAILQAYALYRNLSDYHSEIIDYQQKALTERNTHLFYNRNLSLKINLKHFLDHYILRRSIKKEKRFKEFVLQHIPIGIERISDLNQLKVKYDIVIVGSDQVWNPSITKGLDKNYLIEDYKWTCKKISYAASCGSHTFNKKELNIIEESLSKFDSISVREYTLKQQLIEKIKKPINVVLDPTFLLSKQEWGKLEVPIPLIKKKYLLIYTFDNDPLCFEISKKISDKLGLEVIAINSRFFRFKQVNKQYRNCGPSEFISLFLNAEFIVSNSFHGTSFAINFRKPFFSINKTTNPDRVANLLKILHLENRLLVSIEDNNLNNLTLSYESIEQNINDLINSSKQFLLNSINNSIQQL